jgi:hypothetical protein
VFLKVVKERLPRSVGDVGACEGHVLFIAGPFSCRSSDFEMRECSGDTVRFVGKQGLVEVVVVLESTEEALGFDCSFIELFGRCADKFGSGRHGWHGGSSFGWGRRGLLSLGWGNSCYWSLPFGSGRGLLWWRWYEGYWVWGVE